MLRNPDPNGPSVKFTGPIESFDESKGVPVPVKKGHYLFLSSNYFE